MPKILIVDDEPFIRLLLEQTLEELEDEGVEILKASDGETGYQMILDERPQFVFMDVMMPKMSGFEVCQKVKKDHCLNDIYIVLLTAKGQEFDKQKGMASGADLYMTKPFNPDEVLKKAVDVLGL